MSETRDDRAVDELTEAAEKVLGKVKPTSLVTLWLTHEGRVIVDLVRYLRSTQ